MKKCVCLIISLCIAFLLCGCEKQESNIHGENSEIEIKHVDIDISLVDSMFLLNNLLETSEFPARYTEISFAMDEKASVNAFCVEEDSIYYALSYRQFYEEGPVKFDPRHNTQIRAYNMKTQEDSLLYQYNESFCVTVTDMCCNGELLIWEDYDKFETDWCIKAMSITTKGAAETLIESSNINERLTTITPTLTEDAIYWYELMDIENNLFALYKYDLAMREITLEQENRNLATPYAHVPIIDGVLTTCRYRDDTSIIEIGKDKDVIRIEVAGNIDDARCNGDICVWKAGVSNQNALFVYDIQNDLCVKIDCGYFFSYALDDNYIIVNQENGIYAYDIVKKTYTVLKETDEIGCLYTFTGNDAVYSEIMDREPNKFSVMFIR